jgi:TRAP-type C4-dicarboxylate transport system permease large subunit
MHSRRIFYFLIGLSLNLVSTVLVHSTFRFNRPLPEVTRAALPIAAVLLAAVLLITYVPALTRLRRTTFGLNGD